MKNLAPANLGEDDRQKKVPPFTWKNNLSFLKCISVMQKLNFMEKRIHTLLLCWPIVGTETVPGTAFCTAGNERRSKHSGKHQPCTESTVNYTALHLPGPGRMCFPRAETADGCILLSLLLKVYAKTKLLPQEGRNAATRTCGERKKQRKILETVRATYISMARTVSSIAMGIIQSISIRAEIRVWCWLIRASESKILRLCGSID